MDNFDNVLVVDADGHVYEGNIDLAAAHAGKVALAGADST